MFCSNCGVYIDKNMLSCPNCGMKITETTFIAENPELKKEKRKKIISLVFTILFALSSLGSITCYGIFIFMQSFFGMFVGLKFLDAIKIVNETCGIVFILLFIAFSIAYIVSLVIFIKSLRKINKLKSLEYVKNTNKEGSGIYGNEY